MHLVFLNPRTVSLCLPPQGTVVLGSLDEASLATWLIPQFVGSDAGTVTLFSARPATSENQVSVPEATETGKEPGEMRDGARPPEGRDHSAVVPRACGREGLL